MNLRAAILASWVASVTARSCDVCGPGKEVTNLEEIFAFPNQPPISCVRLQEAGHEGFIPLDVCPILAVLIDTVCECEITSPVSPPDFTPVAPPVFWPVTPPVTVAPFAFEPPPAPLPSSTAPTTSPNPTTEYEPVLIQIYMDGNAQETGWALQHTTTGTTIAGIPIGGYESSQSTALEHLSLQSGTEYTFTLFDSFGDGLCGEVFIYLGAEVDYTHIIGYYGIFTPFSYSHTISFFVSPDGIKDNVYPTVSPSTVSSGEPSSSGVPSSPTVSTAPSFGAKTVLLVLELDYYASETGWRIETADGNVVHQVEIGAYSESYEVITEQIELPPSTSNEYVFVLMDSIGDGLSCIAHDPLVTILYLGDAVDPGKVLVDLATDFYFYEWSIPFQIDQDLVTIFPTTAPTTTAPTSSPGPHEPCNICGNNTVVTNPDGILFQYSADIFVRCGTFDDYGARGLISSTYCATLPALLNETCACM